MGAKVLGLEDQQTIGLFGPNQRTGKIPNLKMGQYGPAPLGHSVGFRCKNRQSFIDGRLCQKTRHEQNPLPAHTADDELLLDFLAHKIS